MAGPFDPVIDLISALRNALASIGGDERERRLLTMADACRSLKSTIEGLEETLAPVPAAVAGWEGRDADVFREKWRGHLAPEHRTAAAAHLGDAAEVLEQAVQASQKTRKAVEQLITSLIVSVSAGAAVSLAAGALSTYAVWANSAATAARGATAAKGILTRFAAVRAAAAAAMRGFATVGRSKLVRGLSMYDGGGFRATSLAALGKYAQIYGWSFGGNLLAGGVARGVFGQNPLDVSLLSLAQTANASTVAGLTGPLGLTTAFTTLAARRPFTNNVAMGALAGGVPAFWNARIEGKSWGATFGDVALFSGIAGGFNGAVGRAFHPGPGQWGVPSPPWFKGLPPMAQSSLLGFAPSVLLRLAVPFAPSTPPPRLDK
ncbi:MAG: hypothetical protein HOW71_36105 [Nonomuraea sp.]|nr:hypothetical protein [Nonomuraea sp.]NUP67595.1 hypothetical protein [Nonomuraea sp.]NUT45631.1 hypothetical protein [Thermoactinospora sp.]